jgi:hypothetical protein
MRNFLSRSVFVSLIAIALLVGVSHADTSASLVLVFQSELPPPSGSASNNPHFIPAATGGNVFCGAQQSPVWLYMPGGYLDGSGAEIHCDTSSATSSVGAANGAWNGEIYLIGIYSPPSLLKPVNLVFEIDRARIDTICAKCWSARFYDAANGRWRGLPTTLDVNKARVYVTIATILPPSNVSGYADRFAVALFVQSQAPTPTPSATTASISTPTATSSPTPLPATTAATSTVAPTLTSTSTVAPTLTPMPVAMQSNPVPQSTIMPNASNQSNPQSENVSGGTSTIAILAIGIVLGGGAMLILARRKTVR